MTLHSKIIYKYRETALEKKNYEEELYSLIEDFFSDLDAAVLYEIKDSGKYLLLTIHHRQVDEDVLRDYAKRFADEIDMNLEAIIKEISYQYENGRQVDTSVGEYRILYERKYTVA